MEPLDRRLLLAGIGLTGAAAIARSVRAGPLDPPNGPVAPTGKTVQQIYDKIARTDAGLAEPRIPVQSLPGSATALYVISQPGSYYLTGNIQGVAGKNAIEVAADRVSIDLGGHTIQGGATTAGGIRVISAGGGVRRQGLTVIDGEVVGCDIGVDAHDCEQILLSRVRSLQNRGKGIWVAANSRIVECIANGNSDTGIECSDHDHLIESCIADNNSANGILGNYTGNIISRCTCRSNGGRGIGVAYESLIQDCIVSFNGGSGVYAGAAAIVSRCSGAFNGSGVEANGENIVSGCTFSQCSNGILVQGSGTRNRIEDNHLVRCGTGIAVAGNGNMVIRNAVTGATTAYAIAAGNSFGPIVNVAGVGDITSVPNANHPWANFSY